MLPLPLSGSTMNSGDRPHHTHTHRGLATGSSVDPPFSLALQPFSWLCALPAKQQERAVHSGGPLPQPPPVGLPSGSVSFLSELGCEALKHLEVALAHGRPRAQQHLRACMRVRRSSVPATTMTLQVPFSLSRCAWCCGDTTQQTSYSAATACHAYTPNCPPSQSRAW